MVSCPGSSGQAIATGAFLFMGYIMLRTILALLLLTSTAHAQFRPFGGMFSVGMQQSQQCGPLGCPPSQPSYSYDQYQPQMVGRQQTNPYQQELDRKTVEANRYSPTGAVALSPLYQPQKASDPNTPTGWGTYKANKKVPVERYGKTLADIEAHIDHSPNGGPGGMPHDYRHHVRGTWAHEATHGINNDIRQHLGKDLYAFYVLEDRVFIARQPRVTIQQVGQLVPQEFRGGIFGLYFVNSLKEWNTTPLYLLDEWVAYTHGAACGRETIELGIERDNSIISGEMRYLAEYNAYATALLLAIEKYDPSYSDKQKLEEFVAWNMERTLDILNTRNMGMTAQPANYVDSLTNFAACYVSGGSQTLCNRKQGRLCWFPGKAAYCWIRKHHQAAKKVRQERRQPPAAKPQPYAGTINVLPGTDWLPNTTPPDTPNKPPTTAPVFEPDLPLVDLPKPTEPAEVVTDEPPPSSSEKEDGPQGSSPNDVTKVLDELGTISNKIEELGDKVTKLEERKPVPGPPGLPGKDGSNGKDGQKGRDGLDGQDGMPGTPGSDGLPGKDGTVIASDTEGKDHQTDSPATPTEAKLTKALKGRLVITATAKAKEPRQ